MGNEKARDMYKRDKLDFHEIMMKTRREDGWTRAWGGLIPGRDKERNRERKRGIHDFSCSLWEDVLLGIGGRCGLTAFGLGGWRWDGWHFVYMMDEAG